MYTNISFFIIHVDKTTIGGSFTAITSPHQSKMAAVKDLTDKYALVFWKHFLIMISNLLCSYGRRAKDYVVMVIIRNVEMS